MVCASVPECSPSENLSEHATYSATQGCGGRRVSNPGGGVPAWLDRSGLAALMSRPTLQVGTDIVEAWRRSASSRLAGHIW